MSLEIRKQFKENCFPNVQNKIMLEIMYVSNLYPKLLHNLNLKQLSSYITVKQN